MKSPRKGTTFDQVCQSYTPDELLKKCIEITQAEPQNGKSFLLLGLVQQKTGQSAEAVQSFEKAKQLNLNDPLSPFYLGEILVTQNKLPEAAAVLEESVRRKPQRVDLRVILQLLGKTEQQLGEQKKAAAIWKQLEELFPDDPDISVQIAETLESEGQDEEALKRYETLIAATTDSAERIRLTLSAADIKVRQGKTPQVLAELDELLNRLEPESSLADSVQNRIKAIFIQKSDNEGLAEFYRKRCAKNQNDTGAVRELAAVLQKMGKTEESRKLLTETLEKQPSNVSVRFALIDVLSAQQEYDSVAEQYRQLDRITPNNTDILLRWGKLALEHLPDGKTEAVKIWRRIAQSRPDDSVAQITVADIFVQNQLAEQAEEFYLKAIKLRPDDLPYRENLAKFYQQQKQPEKVLNTLRDFVKGERKTTDNLMQTGEILAVMDFTDEAAQMFCEAATLAPNNGKIQWKYAEILIKQGKTESAADQIIATEKLLENEEPFETFLQQEVRTLRSEKKLDIFAQQLEKKIENNPESATVRDYWRSAIYQQAEVQTAKAVKSIEKALSFNEPPVQLLRSAAEIYMQNSDNDKAEILYEKLLNADSARKTEYLKQLAAVQLKRGKKEQGIQTARQLLTLGTANAETFRFAAEILLTAGKRDEGIRSLRQALSLEPENRQTLEQLSGLLAEDGNEMEASEITWKLFEKIEDLSGKLALLDTLAGYYRTAGSIDLLIQKIKKRAENPERQKESVLCLARVYSKNYDDAAARRLLEQQLQREEKPDTDVLRELVSIMEKQNDFAVAAGYQETLCSLQHNSADDDKLLFLYEKSWQKEKAEKFLADRVIQKSGLQEKLDAADRMIRQEQYTAAERVLTFLEIHERTNWKVLYRKIAVAFYTKDPELEKFVRDFRTVSVEEEKEQSAAARTPLPNWFLPGNGTKVPDFPVDAMEIFPEPVLQQIQQQKDFLLTLFRDKLRNNSNSFSPKPFSEVSSLADAKFYVLCFLLKQSIGTPEFSKHVAQIRAAEHTVSFSLKAQIELLRFEIFFLMLCRLDTGREPVAAGFLYKNIDPAVCQQNIRQIVKQLAIQGNTKGNIDWLPAAFLIFLKELIDRNEQNDFLTTEQKREFLVNVWCSFAEKNEDIFQRLFVVNYAVLLPFLNPQQTVRTNAVFDSFVKQHPVVLAKYAKELCIPPLSQEETFSSQRERIQQQILKAVNLCTKNPFLLEKRKEICEISFTVLNSFLQNFHFTRYDFFSKTETAILLHSVEDYRNEITYSNPMLAAESLRKFIGLEPATDIYPVNLKLTERLSPQKSIGQEQETALPEKSGESVSLTVEQRKQVTELEQGLQQLSLFAFQLPEMLQTEILLQKSLEESAPQESRMLPKPLLDFLPELTGSRTVDRTLLRSVLEGKAYFAGLTPPETLFFRLAFLCRAVDTKTGNNTGQNNFSQLLRFLRQKQQNGTEAEQQFAAVLFSRLQELDGNPKDRNAEYRRLAQQLLSNREVLAQRKQVDAAETLAAALLEAREQHFDKVMPLLDSIPFKTPQDLRAKEFIAATLGTQHKDGELPDQKRTETAINRLLDFPLSDYELFQLLPLLEKAKRKADVQKVLTQLIETTNDRRIQNELLHRMQGAEDEEKTNAVKIAQRVLRNPGYFSDPQHFALDSYIFCTAVRILEKEHQAGAVIEMLEKRCRGFQNKTDGKIILAQIYVIAGRDREAKELTIDLSQHPSRDSERRSAVTVLLQHFDLKKELEEMNQFLLENTGTRRAPQ